MLSLFSVLFIFLAPDERGITGTPKLMEMEIGGDVSQKVITGKPIIPKRHTISSPKDAAEWALIDSCLFYGRIPANGKYFAKIDGILYPTLPDTIATTAAQAVEAAPEWLRLALWDNFSRMNTNCQNTYGSLILSTPYPYQDEVAFEIAHIDQRILQHHIGNPTLFVENAILIYHCDTLLEYVELVEYPDYTTARYKIANHGQDTTEVEIPKERYYWDVVHPVISDEAPLYINPATGNEASPPTGVFWRDYLFNYPDTCPKTVWNVLGYPDTIYAGYVSPILREQLLGEKILWNSITDTLDDNGAIGVVSRWIEDVMVFGHPPDFGYTRSIQPVRIYRTHVGRCGEHADITGATARAALIPTNSAGTISNDHTWNEWWDTGWRGWEPYSKIINSTHNYEAWGWDLANVFDYRGDGYTWDVVERYTPYCTLTVKVNDPSGDPIDGACVMVGLVYNNKCYASDWNYTDGDGITNFQLGDSVYNTVYGSNASGWPYCYFILSGIGNTPNAYLFLNQPVIPGEHHLITDNHITGNMPEIPVSLASSSGTDSLYKVEVDFGVPEDIVYGEMLYYNDLNFGQKFAYRTESGNIEFFICDSLNFALYESGSSFEAFEVGADVNSGSVSFILPNPGKWYVVLSNEDQVTNSAVVDVGIKLYKNQEGVAETQKEKFKFEVSPSPFSSSASIDFNMPQKAKVNLGVYDLAGRCVKEVIKGKTLSGHHQIGLDGKELGKGVYFIRFTTPDKTATRKIIRL